MNQGCDALARGGAYRASRAGCQITCCEAQKSSGTILEAKGGQGQGKQGIYGTRTYLAYLVYRCDLKTSVFIIYLFIYLLICLIPTPSLPLSFPPRYRGGPACRYAAALLIWKAGLKISYTTSRVSTFEALLCSADIVLHLLVLGARSNLQRGYLISSVLQFMYFLRSAPFESLP